MYWDGHIGINAFISAPFILGFGVLGEPILGFVAAGIIMGVASLPDSDIRFDEGMVRDEQRGIEPGLIQKLVPISHRGITHTIWFALLVGLVTGWFASVILPPAMYSFPIAYATGFTCGVIGICGHIVGDMFSPMGVDPINPPLHSNEYTLSLCRASNKPANKALLFVGGITILASTGYVVHNLTTEYYTELTQTIHLFT